MAILGKIRSKGVLLILVVGIAMFLFIVNDALTHGSSFFRKSRETVASIAGTDVNIKDYQALVDQLTNVYKIEYGTNDLNEDLMNKIRSSVWENLINENLLSYEAKKLGVTITNDELYDHLIGKNIHPLIMQRRVFEDASGHFSRKILLQFYASLDQTPQNSEMQQQLEKAKSYWMFWEKTVKDALLQAKLNALLSKSITANSLDAKLNYNASKITCDVNYIVKPFFAVPDSAVSVSSSEIEKKYNDDKKLYKQDANVSFNYVVFDVKPSASDYNKAKTTMDTLSNEFKTTKDIKDFVNENSEIRYNDVPYSKTTVPADLKDFAFGNPAGSVMGPVFKNDAFTMARIVQTGIMQSDSVKLRHIFLLPKDESKSDSIITAIKKGASFAALAMKYSAVKQTAAHGGEIGWIEQGMQGLDKEITTKAFSSKRHGIFTIKSNQGLQIMQVMDKTPARKKVKLAIFEIKVSPSNETVSKIYNQAKQFAAELKGSDFDKKAQTSGYIVRTAKDVLKSSFKIADINQSRQIIRWAFGSSKGDVSDVFDCTDKFVVATTTAKYDKGYRPLAEVSSKIKAELIKDKKANVLIKEMNAELAKKPSLDALASTEECDVKSAQGVNFSAYQFGGAGFEPAVIGKASVMPANKLSSPIKGNAGVYVISTSNIKENNAPFNERLAVAQLNSRLDYTLSYAIMQDIRNNADISDNRMNFY